MVRRGLCAAFLSILSSAAFAQTNPRPLNLTGWIDVNVVSLRSVQDVQTYSSAELMFTGVATETVAYAALPPLSSVGINGGVAFHPLLGVGFVVSDIRSSVPVGLAVRVPHPLLVGRFVSAQNVVPVLLGRRDRAIDLSLTVTPPIAGRWQLRISVGPTYFRSSQQMVTVIDYRRAYSLYDGNVVDITAFDQTGIGGSAWGLHAGADVAYFFSPRLGVGAGVKANQGTIVIDEPLSLRKAELNAGHVSLAVGLRLRL